MKRVALLVFASLFLSSCSYLDRTFDRQQMYIQVKNLSGTTLRNVEVDYPGGTYGFPTLPNDSTNRKLQAVGAANQAMPHAKTVEGCKFTVRFETTPGERVEKSWKFGEKCPDEVALEVGPQFELKGSEVR